MRNNCHLRLRIPGLRIQLNIYYEAQEANFWSLHLEELLVLHCFVGMGEYHDGAINLISLRLKELICFINTINYSSVIIISLKLYHLKNFISNKSVKNAPHLKCNSCIFNGCKYINGHWLQNTMMFEIRPIFLNDTILLNCYYLFVLMCKYMKLFIVILYIIIFCITSNIFFTLNLQFF